MKLQIKKNSLFILFILLYHLGSGQKSGELLKISVECYRERIIGNENLKFILAIENTSDTVLDIPAEYILGSLNSSGSDIYYEVYYCTKKDTLNVLARSSEMIQREFLYPSRFLLYKSNSFYIQTDKPNSRHYIFDKKGVYKIRFTLKKNCIKNYLNNDISTEWVFVKLE